MVTTSTAQVVKITTVALSGQQAHGMPPGALFHSFEAPAANQSGQVAFRGFAFGGGPPTVDENAIWSGVQGNLSLVARDTGQAVGTPAGVVYGELGGPMIANSGSVFFAGTLEGPGVVANQNDRAFFSNTSGSLSLVARTGSQAHGFPAGVTFRGLSGAAQTPGGHLGISARLQGPGITSVNENAIWQGPAANPAILVQTGTQAPGTGLGTVFQSFLPAFVMNDGGTVSFRGALTGPGVGPLEGQGIWSGQPGAIQMQVRSGTQAPGSPVGSSFFNLNSPSINNSGRIAFTSGLTGAGFNSGGDGIWTKPVGGAVDLVARRNMTAPVSEAGVTFGSFSDPFLMGNDQVAFIAGLAGSGVNTGNDGSIWRGMPGMLQVVLREGDHAPGTPNGVNFSGFAQSGIAANAVGQIIIRSTLTGAGVDTSNNLGLWMSDPTFGLVMLARKGMPFEVAPGLFKTPNEFFIYTQTGGQDGRPTGLLNADSFAFRAGFDDGTYGVFIATIPEPASGLLAVAGIALATLLRRRTNQVLA